MRSLAATRSFMTERLVRRPLFYRRPAAMLPTAPRADASSVSDMVAVARACNSPLHEREAFVPFSIGSTRVGHLRPEFAATLASQFSNVFTMQYDGGRELLLSPSLTAASLESRSEAVATCLLTLHADGHFPGWRNELLPVAPAFDLPPLLLLERAAVPAFGVKAYGVHVNCYVRHPGGEIHIWVARRSKRKQTWPGLLDHMVAGGQPHGISPTDNVVKEAAEEAGVPEELARRAIPTGVVSYEVIVPEGLKRDVLFCYDLELPASFQPTANDGEVEEFMLLPVSQVMELVARTEEYKPNCRLVCIDFFCRHGFVTPEQHGYLELLDALRTGPLS
jgi:isopentenyldiphosphate isomerase